MLLEEVLLDISIQPIPYQSLIAWAFKPVYTEEFKPVSGNMWQSMIMYIMAEWATMGNNGQQWKQ